jgi:anti-sigma B factor antagonist
MSFSIDSTGPTTVVTVGGTLMASNRKEFKQLVLGEVEQGGRQFQIDCRETSYIDSSGLGVLVSLAKAIRDRGGDIRIANLNDDLRTLFALTKLDTLLRLEERGGDGLAGSAARLTPPPSPPLRQRENPPEMRGPA